MDAAELNRVILDRYIVTSMVWKGPATTHTIRIVNLGTSGRPRIDLDAFVVIK